MNCNQDLQSAARTLQQKINRAHTFYRRLLLSLLHCFLRSPLPIKLGVSLITVFLPLGFYLNEQDSSGLNYLADQISGFIALGVGLIIAYTLIDTFNERAEKAKYGNVRALGFYHLVLEISPFLIQTVGVLYQNNPNRQEQLHAVRVASNLGTLFSHDFSPERAQKLDSLIHELRTCVDGMRGQSNFTLSKIDEFVPEMERYVDAISSSHIPRLIETRLDLESHSALIEVDHDLKSIRRTLRPTQMWRNPKRYIEGLLNNNKMSPEELRHWQSQNPEQLRKIGRIAVEQDLIFTVHTLLNLFAVSSAQVARSSYFEVLKQKSTKLHEEYPEMIPKDIFDSDSTEHNA